MHKISKISHVTCQSLSKVPHQLSPGTSRLHLRRQAVPCSGGSIRKQPPGRRQPNPRQVEHSCAYDRFPLWCHPQPYPVVSARQSLFDPTPLPAPPADYEAVVKLSDGFNGADLRNVCTEAGLFAIRADREYVIDEDFMKAVRKVADNKKLESKLDYKPV